MPAAFAETCHVVLQLRDGDRLAVDDFVLAGPAGFHDCPHDCRQRTDGGENPSYGEFEHGREELLAIGY